MWRELLAVALFVAVGTTTADDSTKPQQIHLSLSESSDQMVVTWNTRNVTEPVFVQYGLTSLTDKQTGYTKPFGGLLQKLQYIHRANMLNLLPNTSYKYRVGSAAGGWSPIYRFKTLRNGTDWSPNILLYGDLGLENSVSVPSLKREVLDNTNDLIFHIGDMAYDMYEQEGAVGDQFMQMMEPIAARIPYMTCVGNHEWHYNFTNYKNRFTMPGGDGEGFFYSFNVGPIHFVAFSTEFYYYILYGFRQLGKQYSWLENDLREANKPENRAKRPWIVTFGHRPMYCSNGIDEDCFKYESIIRRGLPILHWYGLEELWGRYGVDVALWGHEHSYERLWPVYQQVVRNGTTGAYIDPGAPVHITTGSAGCREGQDPFKAPKPAWSAVRIEDYGYTKLKAYNSTHMNIKHFTGTTYGKVLDEITLVKNHHGSYY